MCVCKDSQVVDSKQPGSFFCLVLRTVGDVKEERLSGRYKWYKETGNFQEERTKDLLGKGRECELGREGGQAEILRGILGCPVGGGEQGWGRDGAGKMMTWDLGLLPLKCMLGRQVCI